MIGFFPCLSLADSEGLQKFWLQVRSFTPRRFAFVRSIKLELQGLVLQIDEILIWIIRPAATRSIEIRDVAANFPAYGSPIGIPAGWRMRFCQRSQVEGPHVESDPDFCVGIIGSLQ